MGSKTVKSSSTEKATTTPQLPGYALPAIQNYYARTADLASTPPPVTVGASPLQSRAYDMAEGMGGNDYYTSAANRIGNVLDDPGRFVGYTPGLQATQATAAQGQAARLGDPAQVNMRGYDAVDLGDAQGIDFNSIRTLFGDTAQMGEVDIGDITQAGGARASQYMDDYLNPYLEDVVAAAMAEFDEQAGMERAQYEAQGALNKAFGGSGYYIGDAQLRSDLQRDRALTDAGLRSDAFRFATEAGAGDAGRATQASIANVQADAQRVLAQAQLDANRQQFNADALNRRSDILGQLGFNSQAFNADARNDFRKAQAGFDTDAARYGADVNNRGQELNTGYQNQFGLEQFGADNQFDLVNTGYRQQTALRNADATDAMGQFNRQQEQQRQFRNLDQFNTQQDRRLSGAGLLAQLGSSQLANERANIGLLSDLGAQQYQQALAERLGPYMTQQLLAELLNPSGVLNVATGQQINTTSSGTQKQSGGLLGSILGGAFQLGAAAI